MTTCTFNRKKILLLDTAPTASNFVDFLPNYVVAARRELSVPKSVKEPTGQTKETDSVTSTGAVVTNVVKRTSTGRSSPFQTKDLESGPRNYCLLDSKSSLNQYSLLQKIIQVLFSLISLLYIYCNNNSFSWHRNQESGTSRCHFEEKIPLKHLYGREPRRLEDRRPANRPRESLLSTKCVFHLWRNGSCGSPLCPKGHSTWWRSPYESLSWLKAV